MLGSVRIHSFNGWPIMVNRSPPLMGLQNSPDFVAKLTQEYKVRGIKSTLQLGFDEDTSLELPMSKHNRCGNAGILIQNTFC